VNRLATYLKNATNELSLALAEAERAEFPEEFVDALRNLTNTTDAAVLVVEKPKES
jgi:hypothetical protein